MGAKRAEVQPKIGSTAEALIALGLANDAVLRIVRARFPEADTSPKSVAWYRSRMKREVIRDMPSHWEAARKAKDADPERNITEIIELGLGIGLNVDALCELVAAAGHSSTRHSISSLANRVQKQRARDEETGRHPRR